MENSSKFWLKQKAKITEFKESNMSEKERKLLRQKAKL